MKLLTVLLISGLVATAADKSSDALKAAEKTWASATVAGDEAKLRQVLADDLTYTHSTGDTDSKTQYISNLKSGARKYLKLDHEGMEVRTYGNAAVVTATAQIATSMKGGPSTPAHLRFLHVWMFQNGRWQLVAHQSLRLTN